MAFRLGTTARNNACNGIVDGIDVGKDPRAARTKVGFVFTDPLSQLVMPTPAEDLELSLRRRIRDRGERRARALELLAEREIAHVADSSVYDISGGERQRLASLDAFRGFAIAGMVLVNNPGDWNHLYSQLAHAKWHGWTFTDWIFPFFVFISGISMTISLGRRAALGAGGAPEPAAVLGHGEPAQGIPHFQRRGPGPDAPGRGLAARARCRNRHCPHRRPAGPRGL